MHKNINVDKDTILFLIVVFLLIIASVLCSLLPVKEELVVRSNGTAKNIKLLSYRAKIEQPEHIPFVEEPSEIEEVPELTYTEYFDVPMSEDLQNHIFELCENRGIDPEIVIAIISKESNFCSSAVGDSGNSLGLMQIQPYWHSERMEELGCTDLLDPFQNVTVGIDILGDLIDSSGSIEWALMAYNGGAGYANEKVSQGVISDYASSVLYNAELFLEGMYHD